MIECPRFEWCSAPICPADPQWRERTMLDGERVCLLFVEASKHGGRLPQTPALSAQLVQAVVSATRKPLPATVPCGAACARPPTRQVGSVGAFLRA